MQHQNIKVHLGAHQFEGRLNRPHQKIGMIHPNRINQRTGQNADQKRGDHFFGAKRQNNRDHRRQNG